MPKKAAMRPYRRKYHSSWRTRRGKGLINRVKEYLAPFKKCTKNLWKLEPPFPVTAKVFVTAMTWLLLVIPLCYFLVPPVAAFFLINYFSEKISLGNYLTYLSELAARSTWPKKIAPYFKALDKLAIAFFLYDYYQILKSFRVR